MTTEFENQALTGRVDELVSYFVRRARLANRRAISAMKEGEVELSFMMQGRREAFIHAARSVIGQFPESTVRAEGETLVFRGVKL